MSGTTTPAAGSSSAQEADFTVNVNGRKVGVVESGEIVAGPPAMKGKFVAPTQLATLREQKDYHGHLLLSETQEETRLAEAELSLMTEGYEVQPENIRPGMMITYHGLGGRIEEIHEAENIATVSLGGVIRKVHIAKLVRDADFHVQETEAAESEGALTEEEIEVLHEAASDEEIGEAQSDAYACPDCKRKRRYRKGSRATCPHCQKEMLVVSKEAESEETSDTDRMQESADDLESKSDDELLQEATTRMTLLAKRKAEREAGNVK